MSLTVPVWRALPISTAVVSIARMTLAPRPITLP
jgi:hypothetical protein